MVDGWMRDRYTYRDCRKTVSVWTEAWKKWE